MAESNGLCRKHAPRPILEHAGPKCGDEAFVTWPNTIFNDHCAEHECAAEMFGAWIPVSKLMPSKDAEVLAFWPTGDDPAGFCIVAHYDGKDLWDANRADGEERLTDLVTHWMPLPIMPTEKGAHV
jgi:hypothetical protein